MKRSVHRLVTGLLPLLFLLPAAAEEETEGFRKALPGYHFTFPRDHGSHPDFKLEWWYLTGHLRATESDRRFGFLATFFRTALRPSSASETATPEPAREMFGKDQAYLAHIAVLDVASGKFLFEERLNRQGWDAFSSTKDLDLHNGNWTLKRALSSSSEREEMHLQVSILSNVQLSLTLTAAKPKVIFGENGISRKSAQSDSASHYITFTRLATSGELRCLGETFQVEGTTWMDHEFSSSQLGPEQVGWDWASIHLHDGREVMLYRLRDSEGNADSASRLTWIDAQAHQTAYRPEQWSWEPQSSWKSPHTGATYPIDIVVTTPDPSTDAVRRLRLRPLLLDQEITGKLDGIAYWEGACDVLDEGGKTIGQAYVELTGYDGQLNRRLR